VLGQWNISDGDAVIIYRESCPHLRVSDRSNFLSVGRQHR
jgi:hypothetical protein